MIWMRNVTTETAVKNQVASARMEGISFSRESLDIIRKYTDNSISHEKLIELVTRLCARKS